MSIDYSESLVVLSKAVLELQNDIKALHTLFLDNVTFIKGMGDVPDKMGKILMDIVDNHDASTKFTIQQMIRSTEFFKNTLSNKYPRVNIMQEWFLEVVKTSIEVFTEYDELYIKDWLVMRLHDTYYTEGKMTAEMSYEERVTSGELLFQAIIDQLGADELCRFVLRTLFIPYVSIQYLKPFDEYPYYNDWKAYLEEYSVKKKEIYIQKV